MPKLSLVIPTFTITKQLEDLAIAALLSYREQVDEIIVSEDGGMFSNKLFYFADYYLYSNINGSFTKNVNRGWKVATGDYVAIANSDTELISGNLSDLCIPGKVTSPEIINQYIDRLAGPFWVAPKEITKERGMLMEEMRTYCSDSEYDNRMADIFQKVPSVRLFHHQAQTVTAAGKEGHEEQARDNDIYHDLIRQGKAK